MQRFFRALTGMVFVTAGTVLAHATIVLGTLQTEPVTPQAGEPFTLTMTLHDPTNFPVEDAYVLAEFSGSTGQPVEARFEDIGDGNYQTQLSLPQTGAYTLLLRDQTFRQEEATAKLDVVLGNAALFPADSDDFLFPPTATAPSTLRTWLIWLIVLPVAAGILVTVLVLRSPREEPA